MHSRSLKICYWNHPGLSPMQWMMQSKTEFHGKSRKTHPNCFEVSTFHIKTTWHEKHFIFIWSINIYKNRFDYRVTDPKQSAKASVFQSSRPVCIEDSNLHMSNKQAYCVLIFVTVITEDGTRVSYAVPFCPNKTIQLLHWSLAVCSIDFDIFIITFLKKKSYLISQQTSAYPVTLCYVYKMTKSK